MEPGRDIPRFAGTPQVGYTYDASSATSIRALYYTTDQHHLLDSRELDMEMASVQQAMPEPT